MEVEYYVVSAARRSHRLKPGRAYVFGREAGVDILLQDALVSRRHAEVHWREDKGWDLHDLGSRNGVMVNGARAGKITKLEDGDQIQIGGQVFRYYVLPPGADPASLGNQAPQISNVETMAPGFDMAAVASAGAAFTGALSDGLFEMLQFFLANRKTGRLDLIGPGALGSVWVDKGVPVHAEWPGHNAPGGIEALVALTATPPARFAFHADALPGQRTIEGSGQGVLMEVARVLDEKKR